jgi:hypothetical protein
LQFLEEFLFLGHFGSLDGDRKAEHGSGVVRFDKFRAARSDLFGRIFWSIDGGKLWLLAPSQGRRTNEDDRRDVAVNAESWRVSSGRGGVIVHWFSPKSGGCSAFAVERERHSRVVEGRYYRMAHEAIRRHSDGFPLFVSVPEQNFQDLGTRSYFEFTWVKFCC